MNLTKLLRKDGFDLIDGLDRSHKLLQVWLLRGNDGLSSTNELIEDVFHSSHTLNFNVVPSPAPSIYSSKYDTYNFNFGLGVLDTLLKRLNIGGINFNSNNLIQEKINMKYEQVDIVRAPFLEIEEYFENADIRSLRHLEDLKKQNFIIITGLVRAGRMITEIETSVESAGALQAQLNNSIDGNLQFNLTSDNKLRMEYEGDSFPIAVEARRVDFDKGRFAKTVRVTDNSINRINF
jgi:hypothetical protein